MVIIWSCASFTTYLIAYQLKYIQGDKFENNLIANFAELLANIVSGSLFYFLGIKKVMVFSFTLAAAGMLCLVLTGTDDQLLLSIFILGGKFGIASAFNTAFMGNTALFPISVVATSYGICQTFCRFITILSPFVAEIKPKEISEWIFIGATGLALVASLCIKER